MPRIRTQESKPFLLQYALLAVGLGISVTLFAALASQAEDASTTFGTPEAETVIYDMAFPDTNEGRAMYGSIFIGEVVAAAGQETLPSSDPDFSTTIYFYDVEVERSLRGDLPKQVRVRLYGAGIESPDFPEARELRVGERLMFFGGFDPKTGYYPIAAGVGVIPIENDRQLNDLVATFEPLVRREMRRSDQPPPTDPCETSKASPTIVVEPQQGTSGALVRLTGGPFVRPEAPVWWDGLEELIGAGPVNVDCSIDLEVTIPKAEPGEYRIIVEDAGGNQAEATFEVVRD